MDFNRSWRDIKTDKHLLPKGMKQLLESGILLLTEGCFNWTHMWCFINSLGYQHSQYMASWQPAVCWGLKVWVWCWYIWACPFQWPNCESPLCHGPVTCCCSPHFTYNHSKRYRWVVSPRLYLFLILEGCLYLKLTFEKFFAMQTWIGLNMILNVCKIKKKYRILSKI